MQSDINEGAPRSNRSTSDSKDLASGNCTRATGGDSETAQPGASTSSVDTSENGGVR